MILFQGHLSGKDRSMCSSHRLEPGAPIKHVLDFCFEWELRMPLFSAPDVAFECPRQPASQGSTKPISHFQAALLPLSLLLQTGFLFFSVYTAESGYLPDRGLTYTGPPFTETACPVDPASCVKAREETRSPVGPDTHSKATQVNRSRWDQPQLPK